MATSPTPSTSTKQKPVELNWLLLRGLSRAQGHWGPFPEVLERRFPGHRFHLLDLAGAGTESRQRVPWRIADFTADLRRRAVPLREGKTGPWALLAVSLGGMIGLDWAARFPRDFARCVLINTSSRDVAPPWRRLDWRQVPTLVKSARLRGDRITQERLVLSVITNLQADLGPIAAEWAEVSQRYPIRPESVLRQLVAATRFRAPSHLTVPTLLLSSRADRLVTSKASARLASRLGLPHRQHDAGGHELTLDAPDWVCEQIRGWLAGEIF